VVNGVAQPANQVIDVTAAQLAQTSFQLGSVPDVLGVRAFDGTAWGQWSIFQVLPPQNTLPVTSASNITAAKGQTSLVASSLFSVTDADGDAITSYEFADGIADAASGHFVVNGVAQPANQVIDVTAAQLAQTSFQLGSVTDVLGVRAFDGTDWGQWSIFNVNPPTNHAPITTAPNLTPAHGQTSLAASSLFSVTDADSDTIVSYEFADGMPDAASGHFVVNGVAQPANQIIDVTAAQLAQTSFQLGSALDILGVRAFDGTAWSQWSIFQVNPPQNHAPVVSGGDASLNLNTSVNASSLFTVSDADNDSIIAYQFADGIPNPTSGHFALNGVAQPANQVIDVLASQLIQGIATFVAGSAASTDVLGVRAFDGMAWSDWHIFAATSHV
jgi:hypothetical protein